MLWKYKELFFPILIDLWMGDGSISFQIPRHTSES